MSDQDLFREEALQRWREGGTKGEVLRLAPGWTARASAALLLLGLAAALAVTLVTVPVSIQGPATATATGQVLALLPASRRGDLRPLTILTFSTSGGDVPVSIERVESGVVGPEEARTLAGGAFSASAVPDAAVLVWAKSASGRALAGTGRVILPLGRQRLLDVLRPGKR